MKKCILILLIIYTSISFAQTKKTYNIGILVDQKTEGFVPIYEELKNEITSVVGEDAIIKFPETSLLFNNYNLEKAQENYNKLVNDNTTDIILVFGLINSQVLSKQSVYKKPTILFGTINKDITNIDITKKTSGIKNFTYLTEPESFLDDFKKLKELTNFNKLGFIIEKTILDNLPIKEIIEKRLQSLDIEYKIISFNNISEISSKLEDIDAVYLAGGFFLKEKEIKELAQLFIEKKLPSFTMGGARFVKNGFMASNQSEENFQQFFRRIAINIDSYISYNTPLSEMPIYVDFTSKITINFSTLDAVGIPFKRSLIRDMDFVGDFKSSNSKNTLNLLSVINSVLDKSLSLKSIKKDVELSKQDVKTAKSNYLPSLTAAANGIYTDPEIAKVSNGQNPEKQITGNITLQQTVFSKAASTNINIQKNLQKAQEENFNAEQLNTIYNACNAYFNILILKSNLQIQMQNLNLTKRNLHIAKQNFEAGQSGKSDLLRFKSQKSQNTQSMIDAGIQLEQSYISLNQLLSNSISTEIDIEDVELNSGIFKQYNYNNFIELLEDPNLHEPFIKFLVHEAKNNAPEIKALDYNSKAIEQNIKLNSAGRFFPTVALQGQYNHTFDKSGEGSTMPQGYPSSPDGYYNVALNISIPIFNRNQTNINRQTSIIQKEQLNINKENTELAIEANIRSSVLNTIRQVSNIELSKVSEATAKEALELVQTSYSEGAVNSIQLLDAQNNFLNAQLVRTNAIYNYLLNVLKIERYLGQYSILNTEEQNKEFTKRFLEFATDNE